MSYIGQIPATTFLQKQSQSFTPDGSTTSFSLDFAVTNEKDLLVVVNNVIQEPGDGKAYTASANSDWGSTTNGRLAGSGHAQNGVATTASATTNPPITFPMFILIYRFLFA